MRCTFSKRVMTYVICTTLPWDNQMFWLHLGSTHCYSQVTSTILCNHSNLWWNALLVCKVRATTFWHLWSALFMYVCVVVSCHRYSSYVWGYGTAVTSHPPTENRFWFPFGVLYLLTSHFILLYWLIKSMKIYFKLLLTFLLLFYYL